MYKNMSSAFSFKAQPVTRTYIVTQDAENNENGAYYFTQSAIDSWIAGNSEIVAMGKLLTIPSASFKSVMSNLSNSAIFNDRKSLLDMGAEYVIGTEANSRMIVLRRVQGPNGLGSGGLDGEVAYICVENNTNFNPSGAPSNWGRYTVRVARA